MSSDVTPEAIFRIASGFMAAKHLFAASDLGVFEALGVDGAELDAVASQLEVPERTARITLDALVALGLVARGGSRYVNGPAAAVFLAGAPGPDLRPMLRFWDRLSYPNWESLASTLRSGAAPRQQLTDEDQETFAAGVEAVTAGPAHALAAAFDFASHRRVLDVGGGTGSFLLAASGVAPSLGGTLFELPAVAAVARSRLAGSAYDVIEGDALVDPLPDGHDVVLVANLAHLLSPARNASLLHRLREVSPDDARLLFVDFWTDGSRSNPPFAALMAGEFALYSDEGDVYSEDQARSWLTEAGWRPAERLPLTGPQSAIVAAAA